MPDCKSAADMSEANKQIWSGESYEMCIRDRSRRQQERKLFCLRRQIKENGRLIPPGQKGPVLDVYKRQIRNSWTVCGCAARLRNLTGFPMWYREQRKLCLRQKESARWKLIWSITERMQSWLLMCWRNLEFGTQEELIHLTSCLLYTSRCV